MEGPEASQVKGRGTAVGGAGLSNRKEGEGFGHYRRMRVGERQVEEWGGARQVEEGKGIAEKKKERGA